MRFRPANISLINRRHYMPRLLLILSLKYKHKNHPYDLQLLTGHTISISDPIPGVGHANGCPLPIRFSLELRRRIWTEFEAPTIAECHLEAGICTRRTVGFIRR